MTSSQREFENKVSISLAIFVSSSTQNCKYSWVHLCSRPRVMSKKWVCGVRLTFSVKTNV